MGREYKRAWKYLCICTAGVIFFSGCALFDSVYRKADIRRSLKQSRELYQKGDFEKALEENSKIMSYEDGAYGDEALYQRGLIYIHYDNPGKDYDKALEYFRRLINTYPESPLAEDAKLWVSVIKSAVEVNMEKEKKYKADKQLFRSRKLLVKGDYNASLRESRKLLKGPAGDRALFHMGLIYAHYGNPEKDYKKAADCFEKLIKNYPESPLLEQAKIWKDVLYVIERAKEVDIEIEQKKREMSR